MKKYNIKISGLVIAVGIAYCGPQPMGGGGGGVSYSQESDIALQFTPLYLSVQ